MLLPLSFNLEGKPILLVGGGKAALEKFAQLSRTACHLRIVSPAFSEGMQAELAKEHLSKIEIQKRKFEDSDLDDCFMVFTAVDDEAVAEHIFRLCRSKGLLINSADDKARCDFYTTAVIDRGHIQVAVSTHGRFAGLSAVLRRHLDTLLPSELDADWEKIFNLRARAVALQSVIEKKSVITDIVRQIESRYFGNAATGVGDEHRQK